MIKSLFFRILQRRHFWRYATFSDVSELYASSTLRVIAISLASGFTSVYLYQLGYSLQFILWFWAIFYLFETLFTPVAGWIAAHFGSKHGILISNLLYIPAMASLGSVAKFGITALIIVVVCMGMSSTIYTICYYVQFSRVKSSEHAGKELGLMNILNKLAISLSPILGGLIALVFGADVTMWVGGVIFALAAVPLLLTSEQMERHQRIALRGFPWRLTYRNLIAMGGVGFDALTTGTVWSLFIAIAIFPVAGNKIYVLLGVLASVTLLVAIVTSYVYGKMIDRRKGKLLMMSGVVSNSVVHLSRAFITTPVAVVGANVANEAATTAQTMAFSRGMFDTADISGHRIMYFVLMTAMSNLGAVLACLLLIVISVLMGDGQGMRVYFAIAAVIVLIIGTAKFQLYRK